MFRSLILISFLALILNGCVFEFEDRYKTLNSAMRLVRDSNGRSESFCRLKTSLLVTVPWLSGAGSSPLIWSEG